MPHKSFLETFSYGVLFGGAAYGFVYGVLWLADKICEQDEQIEELFSRLEEKNAENHELKKIIFQYIMSDNKLVTTILDAATLTGIAAGIGWNAEKVAKENFTPDPSSNVMNYAKFTAVMAGSIALKRYLEDQKILPV